MGKHLTIRLPWHDRGWDGHVCDNPAANVYCSGEYGLKAHGIRENKDPEKEQGIAGRPCQALAVDGYRPPCLRTIQTFGGTSTIPFLHQPKEFLETKENPIESIEEGIKPFSVGTWPYDRVFRREDAPDGTPAAFVDRYAPEEAIARTKSFFGQVTPGRSLTFFYLNYDNPLSSERRRYVLVGAAEIDAISPQLEWEGMDEERAAKYGTLVWNRFITHGYGQGRGARLPYERYLREGHDPTAITVEVSDQLSQHFKYVSREVSDDEAIILLGELLSALERGRQESLVDWEWDKQIAWLNNALDLAWKDRGLFPGLGPVLEVLQFPKATLYVKRELIDNGVADPRQYVLDRIENPKLETNPAYARGFEELKNVHRMLPQDVVRLMWERLVLFELTTDQVRLIGGKDFGPEKDRERVGLVSAPRAILENPYLIVEEFRPAPDKDAIPFHRVDHGIYLAQARGENSVPGLHEFAPADKRRLRAAAMLMLEGAGMEGHSFLPQDELLERLSELRLPGIVGPIGRITIAKDLPFYEERIALRQAENLVAWMLKTTAEDEELIRERIAKMIGREAIKTEGTNWSSFLPKLPPGKMTPELHAEVVQTQSKALETLASRAFTVLIGGAGTGKTSVVGALIKGLSQLPIGETFVLLAPTGKAAVRLRQKIKEVAGLDLQPRTLHSYLSSGGWVDDETFQFKREGATINDEGTTVIIDECSMLDTRMLATVFRALNWRRIRRLVMLGDPQQLPPIGTGAPFKELVDHLDATGVDGALQQLTINCRQVLENSMGLQLAQQFKGVGNPEEGDELLDRIRIGGRVGSDLEVRFFTDEQDLPSALRQMLFDAMGELLDLDGLDSAVDSAAPYVAFNKLHRLEQRGEGVRLDALEILAPYRASFHGSDQLNTQIQALLRARLMKNHREVLGKSSGRQFVAFDKVLQVQNRRIKPWEKLTWDGEKNVEFFVANGELGKLTKVDRPKFKKGKISWVRFETDPNVTVTVDESWAEIMLDLGYAMTVHKAQGSDFGGVILIVPREERQLLLSRELLYTALTRFTKRLYLLVQGQPGDVSALARGFWLGASDYLRRNTSLYNLSPAIPDLDDYRPEERIHRTLNELLVRSKSEALISNELVTQKIPFHYELPLRAPDGTVRRPDFTIEVETPNGPQTLYWEHWGMLGTPKYDASVERRRDWYKRHGYFDRLIETGEKGGFDSLAIRKIIQERIIGDW